MVVVGGGHGGQGGVGGVHGNGARAGCGRKGGDFSWVRGEGHVGAKRLVVEGLAGGANGDGGAFASCGTPGADGLGQQIQCGQEDQDPAAGVIRAVVRAAIKVLPVPHAAITLARVWVRSVVAVAATASFGGGVARCRGPWRCSAP
ncbi:hypothetical protein SHKM778_95510 (plasmid) [Streptomyces sp. KM77-8]|uniref:Uncharacterized protein n=1 Tax=Streptomyces haneummycinicus TaxID=3074435 RepID=A0AAT9HZP3_9ACTN